MVDARPIYDTGTYGSARYGAFWVNDGVVLSEDFVKDCSRDLSENILLFDFSPKDIKRKLSSGLGLSSNLTKKPQKVVSESVILSDSFFKSIEKVFLDSVSIGDSLNKSIVRELLEEISVSEDISIQSFFEDEVDISVSDVAITKKKKNWSNSLTDFKVIMEDLPVSSNVSWKRMNLIEDEFGRNSVDSTLFEKEINVVVQPLNEKDRKVLNVGESVSGLMKAYCLPSYYVNNSVGESGLGVGDFLYYKDSWFMVSKIDGKFGSTEVFRKVLLKSVDND